MNREDAAKLWPIIKAFGEGVAIQYQEYGGKWVDVEPKPKVSVAFSLEADAYRIKPKPRTVTIAYVPGSVAFDPIVQSSNCITFGDGVKYVEVELPE